MTSSYTSIAVLLLSNIGYYANFFDADSCQRYFIAAPILKGMPLLPFLRVSRDRCSVGGARTTLGNVEHGRGSQEGRAIDVGTDSIFTVVQTMVSQIILGVR